MPEPFWLVAPQVKYAGFGTAKFEWARGRLFDKRVAAVFRQLVLEAGVLRITSVHEREVKKGRPTPMNTVAMLKAVSKQLGIGPAAAMHAAENLYLQGYLSYPRTESTAYPPSFDIAEQLRYQTRSPVWGNYVADLLPNNWTKPKSGSDMGDHPPITPCRYASSSGENSKTSASYYESSKHPFIQKGGGGECVKRGSGSILDPRVESSNHLIILKRRGGEEVSDFGKSGLE